MLSQDEFLVVRIDELCEHLLVLLADCSLLHGNITVLALFFPDHFPQLSFFLFVFLLEGRVFAEARQNILSVLQHFDFLLLQAVCFLICKPDLVSHLA